MDLWGKSSKTILISPYITGVICFGSVSFERYERYDTRHVASDVTVYYSLRDCSSP